MLRLVLSDDLSEGDRLADPARIQERMEHIAGVINGGLDDSNLAAGLKFSNLSPGGGVVPLAFRDKSCAMMLAAANYGLGTPACTFYATPPILKPSRLMRMDAYFRCPRSGTQPSSFSLRYYSIAAGVISFSEVAGNAELAPLLEEWTRDAPHWPSPYTIEGVDTPRNYRLSWSSPDGIVLTPGKMLGLEAAPAPALDTDGFTYQQYWTTFLIKLDHRVAP